MNSTVLNEPYRRQVGILLLGSLFPLFAGVIYTIFPKFLPGVYFTPISFTLSGLVVAVGVFQFHLFDLAPLARNALIENLDDGILVLDAQNRVDINPVAQSILNTTPN